MRGQNKALYVRATSLMGVDKFIEENGLNVEQELTAANIDVAAMSDFNKLISLDALNNLMLTLSDKTGIESVGLELARRAPHNLNNVGPLAIVLKLGETTGECVENAIRYIWYLTNGLDVKIVKHPDQGLGEFRYAPFPPLANTKHLAEHALATVRSAMTLLLMDETILPKLITFQHAPPKDRSAMDEHFGCPIEFEQESNSMFFDIELLDIETMGTDEQVAQIVYSFLEAEIEKLSKELTAEERAETAILQLLPSGHCSMDLVSKAMGMHRKTLQRSLREEGTTYSAVLERMRLQTALQQLTETSIPINRIGQSCGYSSANAFNLAFKKWKNETPQTFREKNRR